MICDIEEESGRRVAYQLSRKFVEPARKQINTQMSVVTKDQARNPRLERVTASIRSSLTREANGKRQ